MTATFVSGTDDRERLTELARVIVVQDPGTFDGGERVIRDTWVPVYNIAAVKAEVEGLQGRERIAQEVADALQGELAGCAAAPGGRWLVGRLPSQHMTALPDAIQTGHEGCVNRRVLRGH